MATLIVYRSKHGCTESCAEKLTEKTKDDTTLVNLKEKRGFDLADYDTVLVGGSIHVGRIQGVVRALRDAAIDIEKFPVLVRLPGVNEAKAREVFAAAGIEYYSDSITMEDAARMMIETEEPPAELRRAVTSKGGTTQAALEQMDGARVGEAIRDAVRAAFQRGRELGSLGRRVDKSA